MMPSGRTYGIDIADKLKRDAADTVEVESNARKCVGFANPAEAASLWQSASAPATSEVVSNELADRKATRPAAGVYVSGVTWEVSKQ